MKIYEMRIHANAIIKRLNDLEKSIDVEANKAMLNQIHIPA